MHRVLCLATFLLFTLPTLAQSVSFNMIKLSQNMTIVGDFNNDGREDSVVLTGNDSFTTGFHAEISTGTGSYTAGPSYTLPNNESMFLFAVGDFNNDGKLDIVFVTDSMNLELYRGNGDGTFQQPVTTKLPFIPQAMVTADVNHDGKMDLVLLNNPFSNSQNSTVVSYFGNGNGGFTPGPTSTFGFLYNLLGVGDFDGDGKADLFSAYCSSGGCNLWVYYGDGAGNFGSPTSASANDGPFTIADVDGDGKSDIIAANQTEGHPELYAFLTIYYGVADRSLNTVTVPTSECTFGTPLVADFNGDHIPDIIFAEHRCSSSPAEAHIAFIAGQEGSHFGPEQDLFDSTFQQSPLGYSRVVRANNSDSKPDFVFDNGNSSYAMVNSTSGTFAGCRPPNSVGGFRICSPAPGSSVGSPVNFSFAAAGSVPMRKVEVWSDGTKLIENFYAFSDYAFIDSAVTMTPGTHNVTLIAAGWDNSLQTKSFTLNVAGGGSCTTGNTITVCSPTQGSTASSPVHVQASTTLGNPTYRFELWNGSAKLLSVANSNNMTGNVSLSSGTHKLAFVARLADGTRKELDVTVTVK